MSAPASLTSDTPFESGRTRALITISLLLAFVFGELLSVAVVWANRSVVDSAVAGEDGWRQFAMMVQLLTAVLTLFHFAVFVACVVAFCLWLYRAYANLRALGHPRSALEHSPGWAVGFFFIPFVNLFMPFRVVREVWVKSDPRVRTREDYLFGPPVSTALVLAWWLTWIGSNVLDRVARRLTLRASDAASLAWANNLEIVASFGLIVAALLAVLVVRGIDLRQEERSKHVVYTPPAPPPPPVFATPADRADS